MAIITALKLIDKRTGTFHKPLLTRAPETVLERLVAPFGCQHFSTLITYNEIITFDPYIHESHNDLHQLASVLTN